MRRVSEAEQRRKAAIRTEKWQKNNLERVVFVLNVNTNERDKAIYEWLETKTNKGDYIKRLIAEDLKKQSEK